MIDVNLVPQAIAALVAEGLDPGKIITLAWIDRAFVLDRSAKDYGFKRMAKFNELRSRLLVEHKVDLKTIRGQGYMVIAPEEQTRLAVDDTVHGIGVAIAKGMARATNVDIAKLSDAARKENTDALCRLAGLGSMTKKQIEG